MIYNNDITIVITVDITMTQLIFTSSKSTKRNTRKGVKHVQS